MGNIRIVGILNVTPDSYVEHGAYASVEAAVARANEMLAEGADIVEIGGESTGPGSKDVDLAEELRRTIPSIRAIRAAHPTAVLSIDTYRADVARAAIAEGVTVVNDVTAGRFDQQMYSVVSSTNARIILMYAKDNTPRTTVEDRRYDDVMATVGAFLRERMQAAHNAGIAPDRIILDPGLGHFVSAIPAYSFEIIARLEELSSLGCPILLSPSRKSFLAGAEKLPPSERLPGTIAASALAVLHGASYIRTHDVRPVRQAVEAAKQVLQSAA